MSVIDVVMVCPIASAVHDSGTEQLKSNPRETDPGLYHGKSNRRTVTRMRTNDVVVGEDHVVGPGFQ